MEAAHITHRWSMGIEARALVIITAVLLAFVLARVYSVSAMVEMQAGYGHADLLARLLLRERVQRPGDRGEGGRPRNGADEAAAIEVLGTHAVSPRETGVGRQCDAACAVLSVRNASANSMGVLNRIDPP